MPEISKNVKNTEPPGSKKLYSYKNKACIALTSNSCISSNILNHQYGVVLNEYLSEI